MMLGPVFEVSTTGTKRDVETAAEAIAICEAAGEGRVVKFMREPNLPGLLPAVRHFSVGLWTLRRGRGWEAWAIFAPISTIIGKEPPA